MNSALLSATRHWWKLKHSPWGGGWSIQEICACISVQTVKLFNNEDLNRNSNIQRISNFDLKFENCNDKAKKLYFIQRNGNKIFPWVLVIWQFSSEYQVLSSPPSPPLTVPKELPCWYGGHSGSPAEYKYHEGEQLHYCSSADQLVTREPGTVRY